MIKRVKNWKVDAVIGVDEPERQYMIVGKNCWGCANSIAEARTRYRYQSGMLPLRERVKVLDVPAGAFVDSTDEDFPVGYSGTFIYGFGISWPKQDKEEN